jgi:hypothetical protein
MKETSPHILDHGVPEDWHITEQLAEATEKVVSKTKRKDLLIATSNSKDMFIQMIEFARATNGNFARVIPFTDIESKQTYFAMENFGQTLQQYLENNSFDDIPLSDVSNFVANLLESEYDNREGKFDIKNIPDDEQKPHVGNYFPNLLKSDNVSYNPDDGFRILDISFRNPSDLFEYICDSLDELSDNQIEYCQVLLEFRDKVSENEKILGLICKEIGEITIEEKQLVVGFIRNIR